MHQIGLGILGLPTLKDNQTIDDPLAVDKELRLNQINICPDDPSGERRLRSFGTSYVSNLAADRSRQQIATSKTIIRFEAADSFYREYADPNRWFSAPNIRDKRVWSQLLREIAPSRHSRSAANYLYLDGHVQIIPATTIEDWATAGFNFALPNQGQSF